MADTWRGRPWWLCWLPERLANFVIRPWERAEPGCVRVNRPRCWPDRVVAPGAYEVIEVRRGTLRIDGPIRMDRLLAPGYSVNAGTDQADA
jgi:hypothetical protein